MPPTDSTAAPDGAPWQCMGRAMMTPLVAIQSVQLASGVTLRLQPMCDRPTAAALALWWQAGRADEREPETGAAHLLEHLACEALHPDLLARCGGSLNGQSGREWTVWHALLPASQAPDMLRALIEAMQAPLPDDRAIAQEARVSRTEIHAAAPMDAWESLALFTRFGEHPLCRPLAVLPLARRAGLAAFRERLLQGQRLVITAAGAIDPGELVEAARSLADLPTATPSLARLPHVPEQPCTGCLPESAGTGALWLLPFQAWMHDAISWLMDLLAHPLLGRLPRRLRTGPVPVYTLDSRLEWIGGMGMWWLNIDDAGAIPQLEAEIDRALTHGFTHEELDRTADLRRARQSIEAQNPMVQIERLAGLRPAACTELPDAGALHAALATCWTSRCMMIAKATTGTSPD